MTGKIIDFYSKYDEDKRLDRHMIEKLRSQAIISRFLYKPDMKILDVGGATGVYSFWLASLGHKIDLIDMVPAHIDQCKKKEKETGISLNSINIGDACDISFDENTYDMVLLMGPLYHLVNREDRIKALKESYRVIKTDGILIVSAISRYAALFDGYRLDHVSDPAYRKILEGSIDNGIYSNDSGNDAYFTDAYFHLPDELRSEIVESGFEFDTLLAVEGFGNLFNDMEERLRTRDVSYLKMTLNHIKMAESDPSIIGVSNHLMAVGKKI